MRYIGTGNRPKFEEHDYRLKEIRDMANKYRPLVLKGMNCSTLHAELNRETFANGDPLNAGIIAGIVNWCFYQADTSTILIGMGKGRI